MDAEHEDIGNVDKVSFRLSLTPEERREVRIAAANAGLSVSAWVALVAHVAVTTSGGEK